MIEALCRSSLVGWRPSSFNHQDVGSPRIRAEQSGRLPSFQGSITRIRPLYLGSCHSLPSPTITGPHLPGSHEKAATSGFHWATDIKAEADIQTSRCPRLRINSGTRDGVDVTRTVYAGGLRWSFAKNSPTPRTTTVSWNTVGVHALIGAVRDSSGTDEGTDGFVAFGASYDYIPALRPDGGGWGLRFQADYIVRLGDDADSFPRVSIGAVYRIGRSR
jgi:hypothetical protein